MPPRDWAAAAPAAVAIWTEACFSRLWSFRSTLRRLTGYGYCCFDRNTFTFTFKFICHSLFAIRARRTTTGRNNHYSANYPLILPVQRLLVNLVCVPAPPGVFLPVAVRCERFLEVTQTHIHIHTHVCGLLTSRSLTGFLYGADAKCGSSEARSASHAHRSAPLGRSGLGRS